MFARLVSYVVVAAGCAVGAYALLSVACAARPAASPRGIVLVVIDTLRADHLGTYGYGRDTSPNLDALAEQSTLFENAMAPAPWTLPSMATLMTSLYPSAHGARHMSDTLQRDLAPDEFRPVSALAEEHDTLAEILREEKFATAAFVQGAYPSRDFGFAQGFDLFGDNDGPGVRFNVERALRWLDEASPERFFLYLHVVEVHSPYAFRELSPRFESRHPDAPVDYYRDALDGERQRWASFDFDPDYDGEFDGSLKSLRALHAGRTLHQRDFTRLIDLYDQGIAYTDYWMGVLLDGLAERGLMDESVVVITSDHGEEFYEHGGLEHSNTYYEEVLRVPLILRVPGLGEGERVDQSVSLIDLLPTLLDLFGIESTTPRESFQGRSLRGLIEGEELPPQLLFGEASANPNTFAARSERFKLLLDRRGGRQLFDLEEDPGERTDRCTKKPRVCRRMRRTLLEWHEEMGKRASAIAPEAAAVDEETRERLRALGYAP